MHSVEQLKEKHNAANLKEVLLELTGRGIETMYKF